LRVRRRCRTRAGGSSGPSLCGGNGVESSHRGIIRLGCIAVSGGVAWATRIGARRVRLTCGIYT
jgi:hypothetical protein